MMRKEQCNRSGQGQAAALKTVARGQRGRPKTMLCWLGILAEEARAEGRQRRAEIWRTTFNSFSRFLGGKDIGLRQMEGRLMQRYENCLLAGGLCPNTTSFYLRNLRSAYSKAVKAKLCPAPRQNPFSEVYTGVAKTRKRAVCADTLRAIRKLDLDGRPDLDYARNLFLLSFYTRGMAFADMAGLRRSDLKEGILCYVRRKTGRPLFIHWEERMQETVEALWRDAEAMGAAVRQRGGKRLSRRDAGQLASNRGAGCLGAGAMGGKGTASSRAGKDADGDGYLLPIVRDGEAHARSAYRNVQYKVNQGLKEIGKMLGLKMPLTMYVARHSWASLAKAKEVPLAIISDGLGHASEKVTRIYLATLDMNAVDEVNRMIINGI
ncbi:MAG: site-specific integrase [Bacteroidetes bacterium]|uniref:Site-specific integrase n=1 Tax=Candidatus Pullibacteroides excrementavium TaxID=2840905 RepID=A0A9D9DUB8_9BACT|nr:site-specific integrase [Candidatus Pullibacteroides excrementavium]